MKKIAIAALIAASLFAPAVPAQAATLADWAAENSGCIPFGAFKKECWIAADEAADEVATAHRDAAAARGWNVSLWKDCDFAEPGAKVLFVCE